MVRAHAMVTFNDPASGVTLTSATVNVYAPGTVNPIGATIFDKNGNTLSNPLTSDATTGLVDFYLNVSQEVDLVVAKAGYTTRTYSNVPVLDDASQDLTALLTTTGDIAYASAANTPARLPIGATNALQQVVGGVPVWSANPANLGAGVAFTPTMFQNGQLVLSSAVGFYVQLGKLVFFTADCTVTSGASSGFAIVLAGLPVAAQQRGSPGSGWYLRSGVGFSGGLVGVWNNSTSMAFYSGAVSAADKFGLSPAFAAAVNDALHVNGWYEAS